MFNFKRNKDTNNGNEDNSLTIKETSSKLDISEATVRKYLKEFDLDFEKGNGTKAVVSEETFQALSEIAKLRANGLSIQEIKELKSEKPRKDILEEIEETEKLKNETSEKPDQTNIVEEESEDEQDEETTQEEISDESIQEQTEETEEAEETEETEETGGTEGEKPRRKRLFNYRYIERQISNDSKRVRTLRQRLKNVNLPVHDRLFIEEALERRILFLDGWKHILRWVSK